MTSPANPELLTERPDMTSPAGAPASWIIHAISLVLIAVVCITLYSNTMNSPFLWDERVFITQNPIVQDLSWYSSPAKAVGTPYYPLISRRYVGYLSFALNYRLHGFSVTGYHAVNLAVHTLSAMLLYALALVILRSPGVRGAFTGNTAPTAALFSALLFAAHPIQSEAVTYIFQRMASMSAMFYLISVTSYAYSTSAKGRIARAALYLMAIISALAAMKTKESAFTLPLAIIMYEAVFNRGSAPLARRLIRLIPFIPMLAIVPLSLSSQLGRGGGGSGGVSTLGTFISLKASQENYTAYEYLITQFRVLVTYLRLLIVPIGQNLDHDYPLYRSFFHPAVMASFALLLSMAGASAYAVRRFVKGGHALWGLTGFGVLWFFLTLSVESSIVPIPMLIDEYRMYLPSAGVFMALASSTVYAARHMGGRGRRAAVAIIMAAVIVTLGIATYKRNMLWTSRVTLWQDVVSKSPLKLRGYNNLANAYLDEGRTQEAIQTYQGAMSQAITSRAPRGDRAELYYNLANAYSETGRQQEALELYRKSLALAHANADAQNNMGLALLALKRHDEAIAAYRAALQTDAGYFNAYFNLGEAYYLKYMHEGKGQAALLDRSIGYYKMFLTLRPDYAETHLGLSDAYSAKGDARRASSHQKAYETMTQRPPVDRTH